MLTVGTYTGYVAVYLASLALVVASHGRRTAFLSSLREVSVNDENHKAVASVQVECEPTFLALGPEHLAVGINNQVGGGRCFDKSKFAICCMASCVEARAAGREHQQPGGGRWCLTTIAATCRAAWLFANVNGMLVCRAWWPKHVAVRMHGPSGGSNAHSHTRCYRD